ncbi:hypothetical protein [Glaciecola petra]|uniref:Uncharacterized protein n=1 Tax=Glaciecola petra TaxID=3075602 RepID=A0ABU2ZSI6_9ALTE|nr:hypothetical protein [Aestuariibacter sp. P117]MDT0594544.1 hypothetical protein [Aestuariibacter sp. P117]
MKPNTRIKTSHLKIISHAMLELIEALEGMMVDIESLKIAQKELARCTGFITIQTIREEQVDRLLVELDKLYLDGLAPSHIQNGYDGLRRFSNKLFGLELAEILIQFGVKQDA